MIYLLQLLCPQRHCLIALAMPNLEAQPAAERAVEELFQSGGVRRRCGICGSLELRYEAGKLPFENKEEALASLKLCQAKQIMSRKMLDAMGLTHDSQEKN